MKNIEKNKRQNIIILVLVLMIIVLSISVTIAYFIAHDESGDKTISTAGLDVTYTEGEVINFDSNTTPIIDENYESNASKMEFSIKNTGALDVSSKIILDITNNNTIDFNTNNPDNVTFADVKWALKRNGENVSTGTLISLQENNTSTSIVLSNIEKINVGKTNNYTLYMWVSENYEDQTVFNNLSISAQVNVESINDDYEYLVNNILKDGYNENEYNINTDFTCTTSSCTKNYQDGLYLSTNTFNNYPTYYFRGVVKNNYVEFNDMLWRIIRVNEDQSIRMIMEDTTTDISSVTTLLDQYSNIIEVQKFCVDKYGQSVKRITSNTPMFDCENKEREFTTYGEISLDELAFSGAYNNPLYNVSESYLNNYENVYTTTDGAYLNYDTNLIEVENGEDVYDRLVINLKSDTSISEGNGKLSTPYVINVSV